MTPFCLALVLLAACSKVENDSVLHNDSMAVIPVGPGTDTSVLSAPDTPGSPPAADTIWDTTRTPRP